MARELRRPTRNPVAVATAIDFLRAYAAEASPRSNAEAEVQRRLAVVDPDRDIAARLVANFDAVPERIKTPVFGAIRPDHLRGRDDRELQAVFGGAPAGVMFADDVSLGPAPEFPEGTSFTVLYTGLYCNDRTGDRQIFGPSDEPYVITAAVSVDNGENTVRSELHPVGDPDQRYGDVDDGEWRTGPTAAVWAGTLPEIEVSVVTTVMEHDEGDKDAYREEVEAIVAAAAAVAAAYGVPVPAAVKDLAADLIIWVLGSGDDVIGTETVILAPEWLRRFADLPTRTFRGTRTVLRPVGPFQVTEETITDETDLEHHTASRHTDRGKYVVTYKISADQEALPEAGEPGGGIGSVLGEAGTVFVTGGL